MTHGLLIQLKDYQAQPNHSNRRSKYGSQILEQCHGRPKLLNIVKHKLGYGAKILPLGREGDIFSKNFGTSDYEKLVHASRCCIYTTAGAITGTLFFSSERVAFCSDRSLKTYSTTGEVLKFQYKVSNPLGKIKGVGESVNIRGHQRSISSLRLWVVSASGS
ncbi:GRAM domain, PH domain-like protein [Artemisia annua]|uniref:GRAM domain, PH domain-like protein n=1 Tax=Artemisia annua TaxID=35608 RepID=A0A2U1P4F0_ARTAN|nr:GRAM domain, PH domain-like protein [Artemisia annua]